jgi:hypothetical protein
MKMALSSFSGISRIRPETYRITSIHRYAALLTLATLGLAPVCALASLPRPSFLPLIPSDGNVLTGVAAAADGGFWVQVDQWRNGLDPYGETFAKDGAPAFENVSARGSIAAIPGRNAYWVVNHEGQIFARGDAPQLCEGWLNNCSGYIRTDPLVEIVGAAATSTGNGLWALDRKGRVWTAGDTQSYGDVTNDPAIPTGIVATPSGKGYYIVLEDGGVFSFGDAVFFGSTGGKRPGGHHLTGIALHRNGNNAVDGYWLLGADGAIYTFGSAPFLGNGGIDPLRRRATSLVSLPSAGPTQGYAWVLEDGTVSFVTKPPNLISGPMPGPPDPLPES